MSYIPGVIVLLPFVFAFVLFLLELFFASLTEPWFTDPGEGPFLLCVLLFAVGLILWAILRPSWLDRSEAETRRMQPPDVASLPPYHRPRLSWRPKGSGADRVHRRRV